jgi:hypothetical protein
LAGEKVGFKDAFYKGMYPLIPFVLVIFIIGLQLLPALFGNLLYSLVTANDLAVTGVEKAIWIILYILLVLLSVYMILSSMFALYIVTLPDMTPLRALRSARQLVVDRRWSVLLRILVLPIVLLVLAAIVMIPLILYASWAAQIAFALIGSYGLVFVHSYLYSLYRALL